MRSDLDHLKWIDLAMPLVYDDQHTDRITGKELMTTEWLPRAEQVIDGIYRIPPTHMAPHEKAALISFFSSAGYAAVARSTVRLMIDRGRKSEIEKYWVEWCLTDGLPDLDKLKRRQKEVRLFLTGELT